MTKRKLEFTPLYYVNQYTDELCAIEACGAADMERSREALIGQGVNQKGCWLKEDFRGWGIPTIRRWKFSKYAKNTRWIKPHIEALDAKLKAIKEGKL